MENCKQNQIDDCLIFEGILSVRALIESGATGQNDRKIKKLLCTEERKKKYPKEYAFFSHRAEEQNFTLELTDKEEVSRLSLGNSHGGILALAGKRSYPSVESISLPREDGFYVMMEGIEDPYNFGYALRSLYAAGVNGVILSTPLREGGDGTVCRSSAGASERMPIFHSSPSDTVAFFKKAGYKIVCADLPDSRPVYDADLTMPLLLVVGGEKRGITRAILKECDDIVRLDYGRPFDAALSAASAASILAFEVFRQNRQPKGM